MKTSTTTLSVALLPKAGWAIQSQKELEQHTLEWVSMGMEDLKAIASHSQATVAALCDVDQRALK